MWIRLAHRLHTDVQYFFSAGVLLSTLDYVNSDQEFPPQPVSIQEIEDEIADAAAMTPKGKEKEKADTGTLKVKAESKRDRELPNNSAFKFPAAKKKISLDNTVTDNAEVRITTSTSSSTIIAFSHTHNLTDICQSNHVPRSPSPACPHQTQLP